MILKKMLSINRINTLKNCIYISKFNIHILGAIFFQELPNLNIFVDRFYRITDMQEGKVKKSEKKSASFFLFLFF